MSDDSNSDNTQTNDQSGGRDANRKPDNHKAEQNEGDQYTRDQDRTPANDQTGGGNANNKKTDDDNVEQKEGDHYTRDRDRPRVVLPAPQTDFEKFVRDATGHVLTVFGQSLFLNRPADFLATANIAAPTDYVLGTGDQIKIHTSGNVNIDVQTRVDRDGHIFIPQVGSVAVAGLRRDQMESAIRSAIGKQFRNFDASMTLGELRSVQIFVLGEARRPGVYTVSSLSTLVNALFASGGPSETGSLRDIQLKRDGAVISHLDAYDLIMKGDKSGDAHLLPGDIIFIPMVGPQVAIDGDITKAGIYELRGPSTIEGIIALAGGLTPVAATDRASLDRIVDHQTRTVHDFPLTGAQSLIPAQSGDLVRIFPVSSKIERAVILRGSVGAPGRYAWHPGMRVADIITSREFLLTRRYYNLQNALNPTPLEHPFSASPKSDDGTRGTRTIALSDDEAAASVSSPGILTSASQDELANHETEINWNYGAIERLGSHDLKSEIIPFVLGEAVDHPTSPENKLLQPGDVVIVYSRADLNLPSELRARFVRIDGEVNKPGVYQIREDENLRELVERAGGVAPHGYLYAAQLLRESVRISEDRKLQDLVRKENRDILAPNNQQAPGADGRPATNDLELRRAYIQALSQIHSNGRVTLRLSPNIASAADLPQFALQDGDRFFIPTRPNTIDVLGNVFNQGSLRYVDGGVVGTYLKASGDRTRQGDKGQEFVLRADGTLLSRESNRRFNKLIIYPGDTVVVPARLTPQFNVYQLLGFGQVLSSFAIAALAIRSLN